MLIISWSYVLYICIFQWLSLWTEGRWTEWEAFFNGCYSWTYCILFSALIFCLPWNARICHLIKIFTWSWDIKAKNTALLVCRTLFFSNLNNIVETKRQNISWSMPLPAQKRGLQKERSKRIPSNICSFLFRSCLFSPPV